MVSIKARRDVRFRFYLPFSQCLLGVNTFLHRFANQYLSLPQVKVKPHYFPIWNSRCCSKLSCFSRSTSNICEWALKQVPRNSQVQRNVSRKRWKGKRALREPLWRSIVLHILSISLLLMISSQRRTDCGMRNISDLIFIWLLPARIKNFFCFDEIKKCESGPAGLPWLQFQLPNIIFGRCSEWIIRIIKRRNNLAQSMLGRESSRRVIARVKRGNK